MLGESYVQINGYYEPINAIASGLIRCTICNQMIPQNNLSNHLNSHILPKYITPNMSSNGVKKITFNEIINTEQDQYIDEIAIKSMKAQQLPLSQFQRRNIKPPSIDNPISLNHAVPNDSWKCNIDNASLLSKINLNEIKQQQFQLLTIQAQMQLQIKKSTIKRKQITLYKSQNKQSTIIEENIKPKKILNRKYSQIQYPYMMIQTNTTQPSEQPLSNSRIQSNQSMNLNIIKIPRNLINTNTKNNSDRHTNNQYHQVSNSLMTPSKSYRYFEENTRPSVPNIQDYSRYNNDFKCPCCGGFYCSVCKSDIPPKYRPIPNYQKRQKQFYYQQNDEHIIQQIRKNNHCQKCSHL